jgi:hypothetical protein
MKNFKIIITKAKPLYWYANRIGETFDVVGVITLIDGDCFIVKVAGYSNDTHYVGWKDCKLAEDTK